MWFSNLIVYKFKQDVCYDQAEFEKALEQDVSRTPGQKELSTMGWTKALGKHGSTLAHFSENRILICSKTIVKDISAAAINEQLAEKVDVIEREEQRPVKKKEKDELKESILFSMMETAYNKSALLYAFIDMEKGLIIVNSSSFNKAEELLALLRKSLGTLPVVPMFANVDLDVYLTRWLADYKSPEGFTIGGDAHLEEPDDKAAQTKFKGQDLSSDEVKAHLFSGSRVTKLQLSYQDRLTFDLDNGGQIKRLNYGGGLKEENADISKEEMSKKLDADFILATSEIIEMLTQLFIHGFEVDEISSDDEEQNKPTDSVEGWNFDDESLYSEALKFVTETKKASVSGVQRKLRIGYNRAARLIEQLESNGIVSAPQHNGVREVLV